MKLKLWDRSTASPSKVQRRGIHHQLSPLRRRSEFSSPVCQSLGRHCGTFVSPGACRMPCDPPHSPLWKFPPTRIWPAIHLYQRLTHTVFITTEKVFPSSAESSETKRRTSFPRRKMKLQNRRLAACPSTLPTQLDL